MRQIKVTYRAVFQQLKSVAMRCSAPVNVEVIERKGMWISQSPDTGVEFRFEKHISAGAAKQEAASQFETMLSDGWWIVGKPPDSSVRRTLEPEEIRIQNGKVYWPGPEDFTHIMDPKTRTELHSNYTHFVSACGVVLSPKAFISTKAHVVPSCPKCAEVYQKEYAR